MRTIVTKLYISVLFLTLFSVFSCKNSGEGVFDRTYFSNHGVMKKITFTKDGKCKFDSDNDGKYEIVCDYSINENKITFLEDDLCKNQGVYYYQDNGYMLKIKLIDNDCPGRVQAIVGEWINSDFQKYINEMDDRIEQNPDDKMAFFERGYLLYNAKKDYKMAVKDYNKAISLDSLYIDAYIERAAINLESRKPFEQILNDLDFAIENDSTKAKAYFLRGILKLNQGMENPCDDLNRAYVLGAKHLKLLLDEKCNFIN
jgi:tetratricopeptide (TPR) repeat protein